VRAVFIRQFSDHAAILAILVPAETPVRDGFGADVLKGPKNSVLFGDFKRFPKNLDLYETLIRAKNLSRSA